MHLRNTPMASMSAKMEACAAVAKYSRGFSGAELANVVNEAALLAGRKGAQVCALTHTFWPKGCSSCAALSALAL